MGCKFHSHLDGDVLPTARACLAHGGAGGGDYKITDVLVFS